MFKPLYERKNAVKTPFSSLKIQKKTIQGESGFFALFAIWKNPVSGWLCHAKLHCSRG